MRCPLPLLFFFLLPAQLLAQELISGPVVGGVTSSSARIYLRTDVPTPFDLELDTLENFGTSFLVSDSTRSDRFGTVITDVFGLEPYRQYHYRVLIDGQPLDSVYSFRSFPEEGEPGHYKVVVGSCNYFENLPLFGHIKAFDPMLFIHLGDWRYPPSTFGWNYNLFPDRIADAFSFRYNDVNMSGFVLNNTAIDYVYDDSYSHNGNQGATYPSFDVLYEGTDSVFYQFETVPFDEEVIPGAIRGYFDHFPGYEAVDTGIGIHHSFRMGNVEFFMLDLRNPATPQNDPFVFDPETGLYDFVPGPDHSLMSAPQREWLLNGLQNSTADWKVIGSSLMFNKRFSQFMDAVLQLQALAPSLIEYAWSLAYFWHAYPADLHVVLDFVETNDIQDVIVISGDSHSSMVDDGTNAGLPELSASGLSSNDEGFLNYELDSVMELLGYSYGTIDSLWNGGGNGVANDNFSDSYGTMEFFGRDSLVLCAMDESGSAMGGITVHHSSSPLSVRNAGVTDLRQSRFTVFPNPTDALLTVTFTVQPTPDDAIHLTGGKGEHLRTWSGRDLIAGSFNIDTRKLAPGTYMLRFEQAETTTTERFVVTR